MSYDEDLDDAALVEGAGYGQEEDGIYVDFSSEEADSESRDFEPLPSGKYLVTITNCTMRESKSDKNYGKPMYNFEFTVVEDKANGKYLKRKCWTLAMCFPPALYTIGHIMKAVGMGDQIPRGGGSGKIPGPQFFIDKQLVVGGRIKGAVLNEDKSEKYPAKYEPNFFAPAVTWKQSVGVVRSATSSADSDLLS